MKSSTMAKEADFLEEVGDEMDKGADDAYGVEMEDEEEGSDEEQKQDRILAAKQVGKALGVTVADPERFASALETFVRACS